MMKYAAYLRTSYRSNSDVQRADIEDYCTANKVSIEIWVEESNSEGSEDYQLMALLNEGYSIVMTDVSRLGQRKVFELLGIIGRICRNGELHLTSTNRIINEKNCDDEGTVFSLLAEVIFNRETKGLSQ